MSERRFLVSDDELENLIFEYSRDVTQHAREGRFDPITGRDAEIEQMILILMQKGRKNIGLLAPAGVGKTAVVAGLAQQINPPPVLASMEAGIAVMYQKCPHLGCRVPSCETSQWFECPCHGSQYNQAGEKKAGPAPRGMERFATAVSGGKLSSTPASSSRARPSAPTPPAKRPKTRTASAVDVNMPATALLAASVYKSVGYLVAVTVLVGFVVYVAVNVRRGRAEVGAELELAANRKPYHDDEQLEGRALDRALTWGLILLAVIALALPLYWLSEPGREAGAVDDFNRKFTDRGSDLFATTD